MNDTVVALSTKYWNPVDGRRCPGGESVRCMNDLHKGWEDDG